MAGPFIDVAGAGVSLLRGDYTGASLSAVGAIPFFGSVANVAKVARGVEGAGDVANSSGKLYHYTSSKYADSIVENGLKPGVSGKVFTTPDGTKSGLQAQIDLALPPNRGVPDALFEIDTRTVNQLGVKIPDATPVYRDFNMPGGGQEVIFDSLIPPEAIRRVR